MHVTVSSLGVDYIEGLGLLEQETYRGCMCTGKKFRSQINDEMRYFIESTGRFMLPTNTQSMSD